MVKSPNIVNKHRNTFIREMLFHMAMAMAMAMQEI
jgi:hypothetical protein